MWQYCVATAACRIVPAPTLCCAERLLPPAATCQLVSPSPCCFFAGLISRRSLGRQRRKRNRSPAVLGSPLLAVCVARMGQACNPCAHLPTGGKQGCWAQRVLGGPSWLLVWRVEWDPTLLVRGPLSGCLTWAEQGARSEQPGKSGLQKHTSMPSPATEIQSNRAGCVGVRW